MGNPLVLPHPVTKERHMTGISTSRATPSTPCRVAVAGASGRMGRMLIEAIRACNDCTLAGALDVPSSPGIGSDATAFLGVASGVPITSDLRTGLKNADVLIDFTRPEGTMAHLQVCAELGVKAVGHHQGAAAIALA